MYLCAKADKGFFEGRFRFFLVLLVVVLLGKSAVCFRFFLVLLVAVLLDKSVVCFRLRGFPFFADSIHAHQWRCINNTIVSRNFRAAYFADCPKSTIVRCLHWLNCFPQRLFCAILPFTCNAHTEISPQHPGCKLRSPCRKTKQFVVAAFIAIYNESVFVILVVQLCHGNF